MSISKILGCLVLSALLISSVVAQAPAPAPFSGGGRRIISPASSPSISPSSSKTPTPKSSVASPPLPPQADSPSIETPALTPSSISDSPAQAPGPASNAVSNRYSLFGGSVAVMLCAAVLAM